MTISRRRFVIIDVLFVGDGVELQLGSVIGKEDWENAGSVNNRKTYITNNETVEFSTDLTLASKQYFCWFQMLTD